jgi:uncharacterized protein (DUF427 family)
VWDYPRPPKIVADSREIVVRAGDTIVARSTRCLRVLETASPPTIYVPPADVALELFAIARGQSHCEWKGEARYWTADVAGIRIERAAWSYPSPLPAYAALRDHLAFYPAKVACFVDGRRVLAQPGGFYGGWITPEIVGPFKGDRGTEGW